MQHDIQSLQAFWDKLQAFSHTQAEDAIVYAMAYLCDQIGALNAHWICSVQFPSNTDNDLYGWRPHAVRFLHNNDFFQYAYKHLVDDITSHKADVSHKKLLSDVGTFRVIRMCDVMTDAWRESDFYKSIYLENGCTDGMAVGQPVSDSSEACFMFHMQSPHFFTAAHAEFVAIACAPLVYLHQAYMLQLGIKLCQEPLTASERKVLQHLLQESSEKEIATLTGLSQSTVHTYATRIYRKYGVKGRMGLMALWMKFS